MSDPIVRSLLMSTAGKAFRGKQLTDDERTTYNELIRLGQYPTPTAVQCASHPAGANMLYGENDEPEGSIRRRPDGAFECTSCGHVRNVSVRLLTEL